MNRQFEQVLKNKQEKPQGYTHGKDEWCQYCIAQGTRVDWREQGLGQGTIFTNTPITTKD